MAIYGCGFISKEEVKKMPVFGKIAMGLQSVFVDRNNTNSRKKTLDDIIQKQNALHDIPRRDHNSWETFA